jgi:hypothetical protein
MICRADVTAQNAAASRASKTCPACGGAKAADHGVCAGCWGALIDAQRVWLMTLKQDSGEAEALFMLLAFLDVEEIRLPPKEAEHGQQNKEAGVVSA